VKEHNALKMKWKEAMKKELELEEEIERLNKKHSAETNTRLVKSLLERSKSRGKNEGTVNN